MAWAQEIIDFVMKMKPWTVVNEYETGLYFVCGKVQTWHLGDKKLGFVLDQRKEERFGKKITLDQVIKQEMDMNMKYRFDSKMIIDKSWHKSWTGKYEHPERFTKNIPYGIYFHLPPILDIMRVEVVPITEVVKELKFISTLLKYDRNDMLLIDGTGYKLDNNGIVNPLNAEHIRDSMKVFDSHATPFSLSGIVRYKIEDGYKAYTQVTDWERSYQSYILLALSDIVRKMTINDWLNPEKVDDVTKNIKNNLNNGPPRKEWGIYTLDLGFTEESTKNLNRHAQELYVPDEGLKVKVDIPR